MARVQVRLAAVVDAAPDDVRTALAELPSTIVSSLVETKAGPLVTIETDPAQVSRSRKRTLKLLRGALEEVRDRARILGENRSNPS